MKKVIRKLRAEIANEIEVLDSCESSKANIDALNALHKCVKNWEYELRIDKYARSGKYTRYINSLKLTKMDVNRVKNTIKILKLNNNSYQNRQIVPLRKENSEDILLNPTPWWENEWWSSADRRARWFDIVARGDAAHSVLIFVTDPETADVLVGDLIETMARVRARKSAPLTWCWFWWQVFWIAAHQGLARIKDKTSLGKLGDALLKRIGG